jgi:hypothetical protein
MRFLSIVLCFLIMISDPVFASVDSSLRPVARTVVSDAVTSAPQIRPVARPMVLETALASQLVLQFRRENNPAYQADPMEITTARGGAFAARSPQATGLSLRPLTRPHAIVEKAMVQRRQRARGAVCNDPDIQGEIVGLVSGRISGCGVQDAVRVRSVSGIGLSQQAVMDCKTAQALKKWINRGMKPAVGDHGGGVQQIRVAAHYACRTRNNQSGARISEHGKGRAIDISGFRMRDGSEMTLLKNWDHRHTGAILRKMHQRACGIFGTVLGPESNRFHRDHFHFDTAGYRSGSFCR